MDFIKYNFNEDEWTLYVIEDDDDVTTENANGAEVVFEKKEIYFRKNELRLNIVLHELFHVYFGYCYLTDAGLDAHQVEEVAASMFADKGELMFVKSKDILKKLKHLRDADDNKGVVK